MRQELIHNFGKRVTGLPLLPEAGLLCKFTTTPLAPHTNPGFELTYLLAGEVSWTVQGGPLLRLRGGDLAITQPAAVHAGEFEVIQPCRLLWLVVNPDVPGAADYTPFTAADLERIRATLAAAGNRVVRAVEGLRTVQAELEELFREPAAGADAGGEWRLQHLRLLLLRGLLHAVESLRRHRASPQHPAVAKALAYMAAHLERPVNLPAVAAAAGVSGSYLHQLFRTHMGQTPADCYNRLRIGRARRLLAEGRLTVTEIAFRLGYSSSQYFARGFRRYTGLAPGEYRRRHSGGPPPEG
ncbi:MAG: AraC family transcriptional regulator [Lentisphaeria bacterium]|jgi:AraC-like DNA-binding protein